MAAPEVRVISMDDHILVCTVDRTGALNMYHRGVDAAAVVMMVEQILAAAKRRGGA
jgi:hypothetical protein